MELSNYPGARNLDEFFADFYRLDYLNTPVYISPEIVIFCLKKAYKITI